MSGQGGSKSGEAITGQRNPQGDGTTDNTGKGTSGQDDSYSMSTRKKGSGATGQQKGQVYLGLVRGDRRVLVVLLVPEDRQAVADIKSFGGYACSPLKVFAFAAGYNELILRVPHRR